MWKREHAVSVWWLFMRERMERYRKNVPGRPTGLIYAALCPRGKPYRVRRYETVMQISHNLF